MPALLDYVTAAPAEVPAVWHLTPDRLAEVFLAEEMHNPAALRPFRDASRATRRWLKPHSCRLAAQTGEPEAALFVAAYLPLLRLIDAALPLRAWLRRLRRAEGLPPAVVIPLPRREGGAFSSDADDPMVLLFLACLFARCGVTVYLPGAEQPEKLRYAVQRDENLFRLYRLSGGRVLLPRYLQALEQRPEIAACRRGWRSLPQRLHHFRLRLAIRRLEKTHAARLPALPLAEASSPAALQTYAETLLLAEYRAQRAMTEARLPRRLRQLMLADIPRPDNGLLVWEALQRGAEVTLLPYAAMPRGLDLWRQLPGIRRYAAPTATGCRRIRAVLPEVQTRVMPGRLLPHPERWTPPSYDPARPLQLMLVGNFLRTSQCYLASPRLHAEALRRILAHAPRWRAEQLAEWVIKTKARRDPESLYRSAAPEGEALRFWKEPLEKFPLPNPVFISVTRASSALLEAIARGIPVALVQDEPITDHMPIEHSPIPRLHSEAFADWVEALREPEAYHALVIRQQDWLRQEVASDSGDQDVWR